MRISALTPANADAAIAMWHACGLTRPWNDPGDDFARALSGPSSTVHGACVQRGPRLLLREPGLDDPGTVVMGRFIDDTLNAERSAAH